jgi:hypothetical protein
MLTLLFRICTRKVVLEYQEGMVLNISWSMLTMVNMFGKNINTIKDSSVGIALGYRLGDRGSRVRFPAGAGNFSLHHRVQNGSGAHPAYLMGTGGFFPGGKAAGT